MRGRVPAVAGFAAFVLLLPIAGAAADPKPTIPQAKAKLAKLNKQADQLVEDYNQANEKYKKSKKKYGLINTSFKKQNVRVETLRVDVVGLAVSSYQTGDLRSMSGMFGNPNPQIALSGMAILNQLATSRKLLLSEYEGAIKGLKDQRDQLKAALEEDTEIRADLAAKKKKTDKMVDEQMKVLRELGAFNPGNPQSTGQVYSGPASGNARAALDFAFAQIGKPYRYGGTGPGSWDCSGLVQASWRAGGVSLPRTSYEQWAWGKNRQVPISDLQAGDLVWHSGFGHVGLYTGQGSVVHAPQTGDVVKITPLAQYNPDKAVRP
ncbi:C40 family peptidase [Herbidospora sp. RD11066]